MADKRSVREAARGVMRVVRDCASELTWTRHGRERVTFVDVEVHDESGTRLGAGLLMVSLQEGVEPRDLVVPLIRKWRGIEE